MKLEAIGKPFVYRWPGGEVRLEPGKPVELPPERAAKLLARASGRVRQVDAQELVLIQSDTRPDSSPLTPVYWERSSGEIVGPAKVTDLAKTGRGVTERFWVIVEFEGQPAWVWSDRLRSKRQFQSQRKTQVIELVKGFK